MGREALADPALRRVPPESLHVTLVFLGYRPEKEIGRIAEIVEATRGPGAADRAARPGARPARGRPRLFALPVESPGAVSLQAELEEKLVAALSTSPRRGRSGPT